MYLDAILADKSEEVSELSRRVSVDEIKARIDYSNKPRDFFGALMKPNGRVGLIAEVKKASPSVGLIAADFDPVQRAQAYEAAGADCLSVLTDAKYFQGNLDHMTAARSAVSIPVLRKDFVVSDYQIYEARAAGADAVLLIVAALSSSQITDYLALAHELNLTALVETHSEEEMMVATKSNARLIGINSRNLKTFVTDLGVVEDMAKLAPEGSLLVAESAIKVRADVDRVIAAGARAILVGETLMRAATVKDAVEELVGS
jgi:indole-3-glycerol phosphate synthase